MIKGLIIKLFSKVFEVFKRAYELNSYNSFRKKYRLHKTFHFNGEGSIFYGEGEIEIGENTYIGRYSTLQVSINTKIRIGKNCMIGPFFKIWTQSAQTDHDFNLKNSIEPKIGDIIIEDAVWIGANVIISPGLNIGENSVIGANSVVTKDVEPYSIVGGVPAKLLRFKKVV